MRNCTRVQKILVCFLRGLQDLFSPLSEEECTWVLVPIPRLLEASSPLQLYSYVRKQNSRKQEWSLLACSFQVGHLRSPAFLRLFFVSMSDGPYLLEVDKNCRTTKIVVPWLPPWYSTFRQILTMTEKQHLSSSIKVAMATNTHRKSCLCTGQPVYGVTGSWKQIDRSKSDIVGRAFDNLSTVLSLRCGK